MRPAKIVAIVIGALLVLIGLALMAPGGFLLWAYGTQRDSSGYFETSSRMVSTSTYALTTPDVDLNVGSDLGNWVPKGATAAVRLRASSSATTPLFIGIGPTDMVSQYLADVGHEEITDFGWLSAAVSYRRVAGGAPSAPPGQQTFWVAKQEGTGVETLEWEVQDGNWTAVIMNADGAAPVTASVSVGARFGFILPIGVGLLAAGIVLLAVGVVLIVLGARRPHVHPMQPVPIGPEGGWTQPPQQYQPPQAYQPSQQYQAPQQYQPPQAYPQQPPPVDTRPEAPSATPPEPPPAAPSESHS